MSFKGHNTIKKLLSVLTAALMVFAACSCSAKADNNGKLKVVTTIFPEYDLSLIHI